MQRLPISIRTRLSQQPTLLKILKNTAWLSADKIIAILTSLLVGAWTARYLGPERLGVFSYAIAFAAIMLPIAQLGLKDIVIRSIVQTPEKKKEILGTNLVLQLLAGFFTVFLTILLASILNTDDLLVISLIVILSLEMLVLPFSNTPEYWFHSQVQAKYIVWSRNAVLITVAILKVGLIIKEASLMAFALTNLFGAVLFSATMVIAYYWSGERFRGLRFKINRAQELLKDSWPLLFAGLAIVIYLKIDQIMLGQMVNSTELGYYSVAVRLSEFWYFIPVALASSVFPSIILSRQHQNEKIYHSRLQLFYDVMVGTSYLIVAPLVILAPPIITLLFGNEYNPSASILMIHAWALIFVSIGVSRSRWLIAENMVRFSLIATVLGAIVNITANYFLIPNYAGLGAAWATVIAYAVSGYFSSLLSPKLWLAFKQSSLAILIPFRLILGKTDIRELA